MAEIIYSYVSIIKNKYSNIEISTLGFIPFVKDKMDVSQLIVDKRPKSMLTESFRAIRTNLQFINNDLNSKIIAVSSTVSGEGKTFIAINLGGIIAFTGKRVVVIDLDMRKPKIHLALGSKNKKGMPANTIITVCCVSRDILLIS